MERKHHLLTRRRSRRLAAIAVLALALTGVASSPAGAYVLFPYRWGDGYGPVKVTFRYDSSDVRYKPYAVDAFSRIGAHTAERITFHEAPPETDWVTKGYDVKVTTCHCGTHTTMLADWTPILFTGTNTLSRGLIRYNADRLNPHVDPVNPFRDPAWVVHASSHEVGHASSLDHTPDLNSGATTCIIMWGGGSDPFATGGECQGRSGIYTLDERAGVEAAYPDRRNAGCAGALCIRGI